MTDCTLPSAPMYACRPWPLLYASDHLPGCPSLPDLWKTAIKPQLEAGKIAAVQARVPTSSEELGHIRPGHFWLCELDDAGGGSPIMQTFEKREFKYGTRFDKDDCAILLRRYLNRTAEDSLGLIFVE
ncbi:hypothetical protein T492DRAFT_849555 [Pavlovales sp. CCMP2436]|nr:hypothetical protein T492DRAFT_849555 [Pavlovales sp. CCMP2436]